jgi:rhodanese-related sulfurtransferase
LQPREAPRRATGLNERVIDEVEADEAAELAESGALVLDVREDDEWSAGHVDGSLHVAMGELGGRLAELPVDRRIVAVCRTGARSGAVTEALAARGYDVVNLVGGLQAWQAEGYTLVADDGLPGAVL